ncbi:MAG: PAS domain S-box protein [Melioribacteraceae bacterium]
MSFEKKTSGNIDFSSMSPSEIQKIFSDLNEKLSSMSSLLNEAQRATSSGSFDYNIETEVTSWSDHNFEILGVNKINGEFNFSEFINHVAQNDQQYVKNTIEKTIKTSVPFDITYRWNRPDGKIRFINSIGAINVDESTGAKCLVGTNHDVTEKKTIEEEIRKSARKLQAITQTTHDGYFVIDKTGKYLETNPAFQRMIGYTKNELLRMRISDLEVMETHLETKEHIQKVIDQGWDQFITKYRCKDGTIITVDVSTTFISLNEPNLICFARDITTVSIEKELLEARFSIEELSYNCSLDELLQKCLDETELLTGSSIGFYHFVEEDQENLRLQMWSTNTIENMCTSEGKGSHYPISKAGVWVDCVKTMKPVIHNDYANLKHKKGLPDGHAKVVRELVVPVIRGNKIKAILGVGNKRTNYHSADIDVVSKLADLAWDIVERKRIEEAIIKSEYKYRSLFESLQQGVFYQASGGKLLDANPAALDMFGLTKEEFEQRDSFHPDWFVVDENGMKLGPEKYPSMIALKTAKSVDDFPLGIYNPVKKEIVWLIVNAIPQFFTDEKTPSRVFVSMQDITERKRSEEKFRQIFDESPIGIGISDLSGKILQANRAMEKISGYDLSVEENLKVTDLYANNNERELLLTKLQKDGFVHDYEVLLKRKNGENFNALLNVDMIKVGSSNYFMANLRDITPQKLAENALIESEEKFRQLIERSNEVFYRQDIDTAKFEYVSPKAKDVFGYSPEELSEMEHSEQKARIHPDDIPNLNNFREQVIAADERGEKNVEQEFRLKHKNGEYRWIHGNYSLVRDAENKPKLIVGSLRDITKQKNFEEKLKKSNESYQLAIDGGELGTFDVDLKSAQVIVNERYLSMIGYELNEKEEFRTHNWRDKIHPDDQPQVQNLITKIESGEIDAMEVEYRIQHKNGDWIWISDRCKGYNYDNNGKPQRAAGTHKDITARKNAEDALRLSEGKWRTLVKALPDYVALHTPSGKYQYLNHYAEGFHEEGVLGRHYSEFLTEAAVKVYDETFQLVRTKKTIQVREYLALGNKGLIRNYESYFVPVFNGESLESIMVIARDVTERYSAQQQLKISEAKLSQAMVAARLGHWEHDLVSDIFTFNDEFYALFKTDINRVGTYQLSSKQYSEMFVHPEDQAIVPVAIKQALESKEINESFRFEHKVLFGNGTTGYIAVQFKVIKNEKGESVKTIGVNQDITERKLNEYLLRASEEKYRYLFEANKDAVALFPFDETGVLHNFSQANKATTDILGYTKTELLNLSGADIEVGLTTEKIKYRMDQLLSNGVTSFETEVVHKNGSKIPMEMKTSIAMIEGKKYFLTFARDITERKNTEKALLESEIRYKSIVQELLVGITIHVDGEIVFVNEAMKKIMGGNKSEEFVGRSILEFVHPDDRQMVIDAITSKLNAAELSSEEGSLVIEERLVKFDGTVITAEASAISLDYYGQQALMVMINDITERKLAEKSLAESEQNLTTIINATPDIICFKDGYGRWLKANEGILNLYELTNVDYAGKTEWELAEFTAPIYKEGFRICGETDEIAWTYGVQTRTEEVIPRANGEERVYDVFKIPSFNEDGSRKALVVFGRDITERKQLENTLRQSEEKFRKSFMTSPDSININRMSDGMYIDINEGFTKMTGYTLEDVRGKTSTDISIWVDLNDRNKLVAELLENGSCSNLEAKFRIKDGRVKTALMSAAPLMVNDEKCILSITRDMTERIEALEAVRTSEEKFRHAFEYAATGKCTLGIDGKFQKINSAFKKMLGYSEEELQSLHFDDVTYPEDVIVSKSRFLKMLDGEIDSVSFEKRYVAKNGEIIWGSVSSSLIRDSENRPQFFISQIDNITARRMAEASLKESEERFKSLFELSPDAVFVHRNGTILYANRSTIKLLKYPSLEEFKKVNAYNLVHPTFRDIVEKRNSKIQLTGNAAPALYEQYVCYDGTIIDVEVAASELIINWEKTFQVLARDISERVKAENLTRLQRDMNFELISVRNLHEAAKIVFNFASQILEVDSGGIYLVTDEKDLKLLDSFGLSSKFLKYIQFHSSDSKNAQMASSGKSVFIDYERIKAAGFKEMISEGLKSVAVVPLSIEGKIFAVLNLGSHTLNEMSELERGKIESFAFQIGAYIGRIVTEQELKQSEEKFRKFFDADLAGDYKSIVDGTLLDCNPAFLKILEFDSKDQALSTNMKEIYPKEIHRKSLFAKLKREKSLELVETKLVTRKGREIIVIESMIAEFDAKNKFVAASGFMIDVTQLKISERALKESEKNYRELFNRMQSGFAYHEVVCNRSGQVVDYRFLAVNPMFEKLTGFKAKNLLGRTVLETMPATEKYWIETYGKVALGGKPLRFEQYSAEVGKYLKVLVYSPEKYKFATIFEDITETKKTEEKIRQLSMAVEQSSAIVLITNVDGTIEYVNPTFTKLTGYSSAEVIGKNPRILKSGHSSEQDYKSLWRSIKSGKDWSGIFNNRKKNGELYWEAAVISPMRDSKGKITHFIAIKEDITEKIKKDRELEAYKLDLEKMVEQRTKELNLSNIKLHEEVVRQKNTEALLKVSLTKEKELSELKTRFISTTSHEFRTPLTSILSSTELLQKYGKKWSEEKFAEHVDRTKRAVEYLVKLLEDVLTISRTESGKIGFDPVKMNLKDFCKDIIKETQSQAKENHKLIFKYNPKHQEFSLDPKLLKFILLNLIVNAYKYSPAGGEVSFIVTSNKKNVNFTISDHGIGIPDEEKPYVYDNFHRSKNSVDIPGTGLGLAIVKRSVDIHRGTIGFISKLAVGTTFKVSLPIHFQKDESAVTQIKSSID